MDFPIKNDKSTIRSWAMFDWANSVYNLVITSTIFPVYYVTITSTEAMGDKVSFFGFTFVNTALSNFALSVAYLLMALSLPFLSAYADLKGKKHLFMRVFTYIGAAACMGLFFFTLETLELGIFFFALAAMGYIGGVAFNNAYLPLIATEDQQDAVSAKGFAYGYVGCVTLQLICLVIIFKPEWFGIYDSSLPPRISFLLVGVWWALFSLIPFKALPKIPSSEKTSGTRFHKKAVSELKEVVSRIRKIPSIRRFLVPYFFYSMGVQTLMIVATAFGEKVLNLGAAKLIGTILLIQLVAILGAVIMAKASKKMGNLNVLLINVGIWVLICVSAYFLRYEWQFYVLAVMVGALMGGIQSLSRSTYSKFLPKDIIDTASFFSFYDVTEKVAIVFGLFSFAIIEQVTDNIRNSALFLSLFFILGFIFLLRMIRKETLG